MDPICYVTQYVTNLDYRKLGQWGEVEFCTSREFRPTPAPDNINVSIIQEIAESLKNYRPRVDYIVTTGSSIPNIIVGRRLQVALYHKILKWNNRTNDYELFEIRG